MAVTYRVARRELARTVEKHGITGAELERFSEAVRFMERSCPRDSHLWWATTDKGTARNRDLIDDIGKRITKAQALANLPAYKATVFETGGGPHVHIVFVGTSDIAAHLKRSEVFGSILTVKPLTDPERLARRYLAKERTPQAGYGREHVLGGRIKGSHKLPGGGDRVRLSRELERDAIEAGYVQPWEHAYARRTENRKLYRLRSSGPLARAPRLIGQLSLWPELDRPVSRLRDFVGGIIPPAVRREIEFRQRQLGLAQYQLARLIGVSQGQLSNALRRRDPISSRAIDRMRAVFTGERIKYPEKIPPGR